MRITLPVVYSQFDPRWKDLILGNNTDPKFNFYNYACLLCSICSVLAYYGINETPETLHTKLKGIGGFKENSGDYIWGKVIELYPGMITETLTRTPDNLTNEQLASIRASLDARHPVIIGIDYNPKTLLYDSHFVIVVDYDPNDENNFMIADSLGGRIHSLKDYLAAPIDSVRKSVYRIVQYQSDRLPEVPAVKQPVSQPAQPVSALPANYDDIIHNSTEWEKMVVKFALGNEPRLISAETLEGKIREKLPVQTVEKEVIKEVPVEKIVEKIVEVPGSGVSEGYASEQWAPLVAYLEIGKEPGSTTFDDAKRVIAGYRSRATDLGNQAKDALKEAESKSVLIKTLEDENGSLRREALRTEKLHKAQIDALKQTQPNFDKLTRQYDAVIKDVKAELSERLEELKGLRLELSVKTIETGAELSSGKFGGGVSLNPGAILGNFLSGVKRYVKLKREW